MSEECVFCRLIREGAYDGEHDGIVDFAPLHPVVPGHRLVVPKVHVADALEDPWLTGRVMAYAANLARAGNLHPCNIMTSAGAEATQSVFHLHAHVVPRREGDGLMLPWTEQQAREAARVAADENLGRHEDHRGTITDLLGPVDAVTEVVTRQNCVRGNHYHPRSDQFVYVVSGEMLFASVQDDGLHEEVHGPGDLVREPAGTHHAWRAVSDCTVLVFARGPRAAEAYESDTIRLEVPILT
jgi:histidine triad (HIT) family protein